MTAFFVVIIALGFAFSYVYNDQAILYFAVIFSVLMNVGAYWFSDKLVLKLYRAVPATRDEHRDLWNVVENLAITAGLPMPRLYIIPDPAPNAFATGRNRKHAVVAVTSGLLQILDRTELEGVIAHELAHIGNRDMLLSTVIVVLVGFVTLLSDMFLRMSFFSGRRNSDEKGGAGQIVMLIGITLAILSPIVALIMQLAISRKREFLADASGALLTRYPKGLADALVKISSYSGGPMMKANNATAHLFISNPFGRSAQSRGSFLRGLFMTHPPVAQRVAILRGMKDNK
ncbi:zinc metalloprotease HtpX [Candidatus Parcubacteria bacterium]|nr:zinc metalloprotease HtpX [Candidatus Parcubacteria bacterium]